MTIDDLIAISHPLPEVKMDIKWEDHLCFNIDEKMFLVTSPDKVPISASFKVTDEEFVELIEEDRFEPAQYLARYKWVYVKDISQLSRKEWEHYIHQSYRLIASKFSKKRRGELGLL